jgi:hypothetical protein
MFPRRRQSIIWTIPDMKTTSRLFMFVALVVYKSYSGLDGKLFIPKTNYRRLAFATQEEAQAALTEETNPENPFTSTILTNGYRALVLDLTTNTVVSDNSVAAVPQTESASVQQAD